jgi:hypothetical protein
MGDISLRGQGRALLKKGGKAMDESMAHEGMESMKMEAKETRMEKKGFRENKKGKMVKAKMAKGGKPGLWANINARKKAGTSRPKSESTISPKAYANMKAGFPKKKK